MTEPGKSAPSRLQTVLRAAIAALPAPISGPLKVVYEDSAARRAQRGTELLRDIARNAEASEIEAALTADPVLDATFVVAVEAAANTGLESKRRLLAAVLLEAIHDAARIDEAALRVEMLRQLDAPHVRCLNTLVKAEDEAVALGEIEERAPRAEPTLSPRLIEAAETMPGPVIAVLISQGLVEATSTWDGTFIVQQVTPTGRALIEDLSRFSSGSELSRDQH